MYTPKLPGLVGSKNPDPVKEVLEGTNIDESSTTPEIHTRGKRTSPRDSYREEKRRTSPQEHDSLRAGLERNTA